MIDELIENVVEIAWESQWLMDEGKYIPDMQGHSRSTEEALSLISTPMSLSFTHDPTLDPEFSTKSPFLIDEFKIWNYSKTDFNL